MWEFVLALLLGIVVGTFTGLAPGIHINLIAALLLSSIEKFSYLEPISLAVFVVSMSITHTFLDFIPSIYLGAPEEDTFLSVLPGHQLLKEGRGHEAVLLTLSGSLLALPIIIIFTPLFIYFLPSFFDKIKFVIPFILIFISLYLILREKDFLISTIIFILAGFLGFFSFNLPIKDPLLPLLTGLFGISSLITSLKNSPKLKKQKFPKLLSFLSKTKKEFKKAVLGAIISAPLCSFLPGIGSGHATTIGSEIIPQGNRGFLILNGIVSTIIMALSFITVYSIGKSRSGTAAAIKEILQKITLPHLLTLLMVIIIAAIISFFLGIYLSKLLSSNINKINYKKLTIIVIFLLIFVNLIFSNPLGIVVLITSTALGIFTILSNSKRINLMGSLIIPAVIYYLMN